MEDFLAEGKPWRKVADVLEKIGIRLPLPVKLKRAQGLWSEDEMGDKVALVGHGSNTIDGNIARIMFSLKIGAVDELTRSKEKYNILAFDASMIDTTEGLEKVYSFFHNDLQRLLKNGRVIIIGRNTSESPEVGAVQQALVGFTKALSKEVGKRGITVNLIRAKENKVNLTPVVWFFASNHSSFITGQVLDVSNNVALPEAINYAKPLQGKTALVTGAARGIGNSIARRLAEEGATVIVVDRKEMQAAAESVANEIKGKTLLLDITAPEAPKAIKDFIIKNFPGALDIIIHNAGITRDRTLANMDKATWDTVIAVNLTSAIRINDELLQGTLNNNGRIVCMASISGIGGIFGQTNYSATKAGLIGYVKSLAEQVADKGITANAIAPGFIETEMTNQIPFMTRETGRRVNAFAQGGLPIDVAELAVFLSTPNSAGVTGQTIRVCGGNIMGA